MILVYVLVLFESFPNLVFCMLELKIKVWIYSVAYYCSRDAPICPFRDATPTGQVVLKVYLALTKTKSGSVEPNRCCNPWDPTRAQPMGFLSGMGSTQFEPIIKKSDELGGLTRFYQLRKTKHRKTKETKNKKKKLKKKFISFVKILVHTRSNVPPVSRDFQRGQR